MTLGVKRDIKRLKKNLEHFGAVREDVEALALQDRGVESWWKNMNDVMFDVDDVIDHFMVHSQKLLLPPRMVCCSQSLFSFITKHSFDHRVAKRIKDINRKLDEIQKNRNMFGLERTNSQQFQVNVVDKSQTSPIDELEVFGRDIRQATDDIVKRILSNFDENGPTVFGIQGMGGIGKTTLAQKIYNEQWIREKFQVHIWLCISQSYTEIGLLRQAIRMAGAACDQLETKTELLLHLMDTIRGKNVFLVLDDVWKSDVWIDLLRSPFERCSNANILVTTRNLDVLAGMHATYTHQVNKMNDYDGLELLMKKSFRPYAQISEFTDVGYQIVKKCDGLPLAIVVVAGVLSTKRTREEWESIRDGEWSIHGLPKELGGPLYLSYSSLPPQLKQCFLWCALLPPNFAIDRNAVVYCWVAEGFVRKGHKYSIYEIAEEYYHELIRRNLLQPKPEFVDKAISTMHDLLRSLGQYLTRHHSLFMNAENNEALPNLRRISISSAVEEIPSMEEQKCMRSLLMFNNKNFKSIHTNIFRKLEHIRVLVLSGTGILTMPESVGNLVLLRLLDLSYTEISKLPDSIGRLISLEYLSLRGCHKLDSLPVSLMRLSQICFLQLEQTAIDHVPKGIAMFQQLYYLRGVFERGSELITMLMRLIKLRKSEMLMPSPSLVYIFLVGFPGARFPEWLCSEPERKLPNLAHMLLNHCISCSQLPPAGQMPELLVVQIRGADAVVSIGAELLGKGNLCDSMKAKSRQLVMMPCLKRLWLRDCPKLKALPEDLHRAANLKRIQIEGAHKLQEVVNLPEVVWLKVKNNRSLRRISNLHKLQDLLAQDCPELDEAENLRSLKRVYMVDCLNAQQFRNCLLKEEQDILVHVATVGADGRDIFPDESLYH
ncbi:unnamed protein product [Urochloa decumbens]|uniref:Uncharacterized protein n=1 Tax=Urochloa decumbens TaxID=240449 RepID=A0ABC8ZCM6_9POAL